ncbi:MAG: Hpt domain-containing protein [Gammaproteobacteria bacterium]|jgi:HPt (histidine-containing phosphotransfer) domain-containing protein|nr:Hpt domain-containing protein [Gammaproteobacteria bacterium]
MAIFKESASKYLNELRQSFDEENWDGVKKVSHTLKGAAASFGFPKLTQRAKELCEAFETEQTAEIPAFSQALIDELESAHF